MSTKLLSLSKNEDFKSILAGRKISNKYLTIFFKKLSGKSNKYLNISFIAQKKLGNAIKRNKIKRRLRNIVDHAIKELIIKLDYSYLVIAKPTMLSNNYTNIKETLFQDLKKIR